MLSCNYIWNGIIKLLFLNNYKLLIKAFPKTKNFQLYVGKISFRPYSIYYNILTHPFSLQVNIFWKVLNYVQDVKGTESMHEESGVFPVLLLSC